MIGGLFSLIKESLKGNTQTAVKRNENFQVLGSCTYTFKKSYIKLPSLRVRLQLLGRL